MHIVEIPIIGANELKSFTVLCILFFFISDSNFVLGNAQASSCPIVYCSDGFCELTGYARAQVMGKSCACKFLYGADSEEQEKTKIDEALDKRQELNTEIFLYRRNSKWFSFIMIRCLPDW